MSEPCHPSNSGCFEIEEALKRRNDDKLAIVLDGNMVLQEVMSCVTREYERHSVITSMTQSNDGTTGRWTGHIARHGRDLQTVTASPGPAKSLRRELRDILSLADCSVHEQHAVPQFLRAAANEVYLPSVRQMRDLHAYRWQLHSFSDDCTAPRAYVESAPTAVHMGQCLCRNSSRGNVSKMETQAKV